MFNLYRQETKDCFATGIGAGGLGKKAFKSALKQTSEALQDIRAAHADGSLPMLRLPGNTDDLDNLKPVAERFRANFAHVVVLGTGGSSLGGQTVCQLADRGFGPLPGAPKLHFLDNIDPDTFAALFAAIDLAQTGFIVISKSGGTAETLSQFLVCLDALIAEVGRDRVGHHVIVITEPTDNPLRRLGLEWGLTALDHDPGIGGRFSVLSLVGLLPCMIAGLDAYAVRAGAAEVLDTVLNSSDPGDCPPALGAALSIGLLDDRGARTTVIMPYVDRLTGFGAWYQQLWAESLGKDGKGTTPVRAVGTTDQHSQLQLYLDGPRDKMFTLMFLDLAGTGGDIGKGAKDDPSLAYLKGRTMGDLMDVEQRATAATLAANGCPTRIFSFSRLDEKVMGGLLMHFMLETMIAAHLLGVNAFDQPAVEQGKVLARQYLAQMDKPE